MATAKWKVAAQRVRDLKDPWEGIDFDSLPERRATRHVYNSRNKSWWKDEVVIKIQDKLFASGAMRECYRMKKLSKFSAQPDWQNASNYVAKCYMSDQPRNVYEQDVKLQMDAKMWGEKYNKRNPPKKVDFFQAYIIELKEPLSNGKSLFCVEHFMEGNYIKYNSNSGYISDIYRLTPQAFSHFTFEKSCHQLIVVDIQGVGDLYTDPQIHTNDMEEYGEANLGTKGMALFFSSHLCSPLCFALGLTQFDLSDEEMARINIDGWKQQSSTVIALNEDEIMSSTCCDNTRETLNDVFKRVGSFNSLQSPALNRVNSFEAEGSPLGTPEDQRFSFEQTFKKALAVNNEDGIQKKTRSDSDTDTVTRITENVHKKTLKGRRSASVTKELGIQSDIEQLKEKLRCLGEIHYEMALYHSIGRFTPEPDLKTSMFHLHKAGECGVSLALYELGCMYLQLPHSELETLSVESNTTHETMGLGYMIQAAETGLKAAMIIAGRILETGNGIGTRQQDWLESVKWYTLALETTEMTDDSPEPDYIIMAKLANMYSTGGFGLSIDYQKAGDYYQQAADIAMENMKGKVANKYYMLAEEMWSKIE